MGFLDQGRELRELAPLNNVGLTPAKARLQTTRAAKHEALRASRLAVLREILPADLRSDTVYHLITGGDIDALGVLSLILERLGRLDFFAGATFSMSETDAQMITGYLAEGKIERAIILAGTMLQGSQPAAYAAISVATEKLPLLFRMVHNHSKVCIFRNEAAGLFLVMEGSANFCSNSAAENLVITNSPELYQFFYQWFNDTCEQKSRIIHK